MRRISVFLAAITVASPTFAATFTADAFLNVAISDVIGNDVANDIDFIVEGSDNHEHQTTGFGSAYASSDLSGDFPLEDRSSSASIRVEGNRSARSVNIANASANNTLLMYIFNMSNVHSYTFELEWSWSLSFSSSGFGDPAFVAELVTNLESPCGDLDFAFDEMDPNQTYAESGTCKEVFILEPMSGGAPSLHFISEDISLSGYIEAPVLTPVPLTTSLGFGISSLGLLAALSGLKRKRHTPKIG